MSLSNGERLHMATDVCFSVPVVWIHMGYNFESYFCLSSDYNTKVLEWRSVHIFYKLFNCKTFFFKSDSSSFAWSDSFNGSLPFMCTCQKSLKFLHL